MKKSGGPSAGENRRIPSVNINLVKRVKEGRKEGRKGGREEGRKQERNEGRATQGLFPLTPFHGIRDHVYIYVYML